MAFKVLMIFFISVFSVGGYGAIFKCADADGHIIYSDTVCDTNANRQAVETPRRPEIATEPSIFSVFAEEINDFIDRFINHRALTSKIPGNQLAVPQNTQCDGRTRCPQMTSCDEAIFFIQHCPNTEMDGDGDGIPCESQWCR